jgi:hypothetical protein
MDFSDFSSDFGGNCCCPWGLKVISISTSGNNTKKMGWSGFFSDWIRSRFHELLRFLQSLLDSSDFRVDFGDESH